jgi:hypothetical protein
MSTSPAATGRRAHTSALVASAGLLMTAFVSGCGSTAVAPPGAPASPATVAAIAGPLGGAASCLTPDAINLLPPVDTAFGADSALPLSPNPVAVTGGVGAPISPPATQPPGSLRVQQAITDFPVPAASAPGPDLVVTLVELSGQLPSGVIWNPDQSMAMRSIRQLGPGQVMTWQSCVLRDPRIAAAMRSAGRSPIPATAAATPTAVSGWAAFATPRSADRRDLALSLASADGSSSSSTISLARPSPTPPGH